MMRSLQRAFTRIFLLFIFIAFFLSNAHSQNFNRRLEEEWTNYKDPQFGFKFDYPSTIFEIVNNTSYYGKVILLSKNKRAKITVSGADNDLDFVLAEYRDLVISMLEGEPVIDYSPIGQSWFVLSGNLGSDIFYHKVIFSCDFRLINSFEISFPSVDKVFYERLVEIMEDHFKPARGADEPERCRL